MPSTNDVNFIDKIQLGSTDYPVYGCGISIPEENSIPGNQVAKNTLTQVTVPNSWTADTSAGGTRYKQTIQVVGVKTTMNLTCYPIPSSNEISWEEWKKEKKGYDIFSTRGQILILEDDKITLYSDKIISQEFCIGIMGV